jgi:hypothetical protein
MDTHSADEFAAATDVNGLADLQAIAAEHRVTHRFPQCELHEVLLLDLFLCRHLEEAA